MSLMTRLSSLATVLLAVGCGSLNAGDGIGGGGGGLNEGGGGGGDPVPGVGGGGAATAESTPELTDDEGGFQPEGNESGPLCPKSVEQTATLATPKAEPGFASVQYARGSLGRGRWPDPTGLRADDFVRYYTDVLPLEIADGETAELRSSLRPGVAENTWDLTVRARVAGDAAPASLHLIVVVDTSESTERVIPARDAVLSAIAEHVAGSGDMLSVVAFGDPPVVALDHASGADVATRLEEAHASLGPRPGGDIVKALETAGSLMVAEEAPHVLVLTDGGILWGEKIAFVLDGLRSTGVTSIAQLGPSDMEAPLTLNSALLEGVAGATGNRLFFPSDAESSDVSEVFGARFDEIFRSAVPNATFEVRLPSGLTPILPPSDQPVPRTGRVGTGRTASATLVTELACSAEIAFGSTQSFIDVRVLDDSGAERYRGTQTVASASDDGDLESAIELTVSGLRTRDSAILSDAWAAVDALGLENEQLCPADPTSCAERPLCCVRDDLQALLSSSCPVQEDKASFCQ